MIKYLTTNSYKPNKVITIFIEHNNNIIEPVSYEIIGKAKELASHNNMSIFAVLLITKNDALDLTCLEHLVDHIDIYKYNENFIPSILNYRDCLKNTIEEYKPSIVFIGATKLGRSFAPRVAAHFRTGITADCTELEFNEENKLIQIRPAYGEDVRAKIITPYTYPQIATIRPGVMEFPKYKNSKKATIKNYEINNTHTEIQVIKKTIIEKQNIKIEEAEVIVLAGNAIKYTEELEIIKKLSKLLKGEWAVTRPLVEGGLADYERQIGISGKTIRPKVIIAFGVSGTTQTLSGISKAKKIIAINKDKNAPIFKNSDVGIIDDWKIIAKTLINKLK